MSRQDGHDRYKDLQQVERNFRRLKTAFRDVRPLYGRQAPRMRGHVFIAMLALKVLRVREQRRQSAFGTRETNDNAETVESALGALSRLSLQHYQGGPEEMIALPRPDARQQHILTALDVKLWAP